MALVGTPGGQSGLWVRDAGRQCYRKLGHNSDLNRQNPYSHAAYLPVGGDKKINKYIHIHIMY